MPKNRSMPIVKTIEDANALLYNFKSYISKKKKSSRLLLRMLVLFIILANVPNFGEITTYVAGYFAEEKF